MRKEETLQAWLTFAQETYRMARQAKTEQDFAPVYARDNEGQRLWEACLADGWTVEDANRAFGREVGR